MEELVDWLAELTRSGMVVWRKAETTVNLTLNEYRLKRAYEVVNYKPCLGKKFGGAYIGLRTKRNILCVAINTGDKNWIYLDAREGLKQPIMHLYWLVKRSKSKRGACTRCQMIEGEDSRPERAWKRIVRLQARTIASQRAEITRLQCQLTFVA